jgi:hypothetical protein
LRLSPPWGHRLGADFSPRTGEGWSDFKADVRGRCVQFGHDDASSKVWVRPQASVVSLSGVSNGFLCAQMCCCGVGAAAGHV